MNTLKKELKKWCLYNMGILRDIPQTLLRGKSIILFACILIISCAEELPDYPVPLDNPSAELIKLDAATDKSKLVYSWVGLGIEHSRGFEFSLYKVNEQGIIIETVGIEKEEVLGTSVERPQEMNTRYKAVLNILGDKQNRSNAQKPLELFWNNIPIKLQSPAITIDGESNETKLLFSWQAVNGAGGYEFSLYLLDRDGDEVGAEVIGVVGVEKEVISGTSVERPYQAGAFYRVVLKALGNENLWPVTLAGEPVVRNWYKAEVIPNGTNLTEFFRANPIEAKTYVLDGSYTMNGNIELGAKPVVIRGFSKNSPSKITVTNGSFVNGGAALKLENLDFDYSGFITDNDNLNNNAVILMNSVQQGTTFVNISENVFCHVPATQPIVLQSCKITGLKGYLFYDNNQRYAIETLLIDDCIIGMNTGTWGNATLRFQLSLVRDFTITKSTIYNLVTPSNSNNRFMQFNHNNYATQIEGWAGGTMTITNCTFWQAGNTAQSFNSNNAMGRPDDLVTVQKNVFVDSYENGRIVSRFRRGNTNAKFAGGQNTQWYDGANFTGSQDVTADTDHITSNPGLTYNNGVFTMSGAEQQAARTGDPRWLK